VEILRDVSINWLSKKWWFFGFSWLLILLGIIGYVIHGGLSYGIDFTGGTIIQLKFKKTPDLDLIRRSLKTESATPPLIQRYGQAGDNEIQVRMQTAYGTGKSLEGEKQETMDLLRKTLDPDHATSTQMDFNNIRFDALYKYLLGADPDNQKAQSKSAQEFDQHYKALANALIEYRDIKRGGIIGSFDDLTNVAGASSALIANLNSSFYAGPFAQKGLESVGAIVGADLKQKAEWAVGLSFLAMLVYIGFRFKPIYGVAAVVALFHDLAITLGLFALTNKEISMTVIAALLTLVGYSMNDTIVVFDRVRENLRLMRKDTLRSVLNTSINQTLSRTIMTSGMTFLSVFALFIFGGEVLNGFSFALTVGIIIGTYSSIGIASPIVDWWYKSTEQKLKKKTA
jgi:preprotein translocase subunit SecF